MALSQRYTGHNAVVRWFYANGTAVGTVDLSSDYRTITTTESVAAADMTAGADTYANKAPTFADMTMEVTMMSAAGDGSIAWNALMPRATGSIEWSPQGSGTGCPKYTAAAYVADRRQSIPYNNAVENTYSFQITALPAGTVWTA